ncbi:hypothetical protein vseg_006232 [Gypsophila vaccaria]
MWASLGIQRLACIFAFVFVITDPKVYVDGADDKDLLTIFPSDYKDALGSEATILNNIWNTYSIRYVHNSENVTTIIYTGPYTQGWVGIGLSKTGGMIGSSAMVGWTGGGGKNLIKQYSLQGYNPAKVIVNKGDLGLTKVSPASTIIKGNIYMAFQIKFPNNTMKQKLIFTSSPNFPTGDVLTMHTQATMKEIDFSKGDVDSSASSRKAIHGVIAFLAWQVLIPVGILFPRFFKHLDPLWFYLHMSVQITGYVLAFITVILGLRVSSDLHIDWGLHKFVGILVLCLATLQVLAIWARPAKDSPWRKYWNMYHHGVGYTTTLLALLNFVMGLLVSHAGLAFKIVFALWFILLAVFVILIAPRIKKTSKVETLPPPGFNQAS